MAVVHPAVCDAGLAGVSRSLLGAVEGRAHLAARLVHTPGKEQSSPGMHSPMRQGRRNTHAQPILVLKCVCERGLDCRYERCHGRHPALLATRTAPPPSRPVRHLGAGGEKKRRLWSTKEQGTDRGGSSMAMWSPHATI